ncbi:hypothetical protein F7C95_06420 [Opitutia bacterium ISCC 51]|nr:hypothetical protein F7C95_06420 [Opitutae bacterium ISCC 51]QXD29595.1 hypothetical protein GA003_06390 [Opitutae bacterium ISCC 52]
MQTPNIATFDSSLPDDSVEEEGEIAKPNGSVLGELIAAELRESGWSISVVEQRGNTGWSFWGKHKGIKFWCLLGYTDPWIMIAVDRRFFLRRWIGGSSAFLTLLHEMNQVLQGIEEISKLVWLTESEYEAARASPV